MFVNERARKGEKHAGCPVDRHRPQLRRTRQMWGTCRGHPLNPSIHDDDGANATTANVVVVGEGDVTQVVASSTTHMTSEFPPNCSYPFHAHEDVPGQAHIMRVRSDQHLIPIPEQTRMIQAKVDGLIPLMVTEWD